MLGARRSMAVSVLSVAAATIAGCSSPAGSSQGPAPVDAAVPAGPPSVQISPPGGSDGVRLDTSVVVRAANGTITDLVARSQAGPLAGTFDPGRRTWTSVALTGGTAYAVSAVVTGGYGRRATSAAFLRTLTPARELTYSVNPEDGELVGVGTPITVHFDVPVTDRASVQRRLRVTNDHVSQAAASPSAASPDGASPDAAAPPADGQVDGAWHWYTGSDVRFRPRVPWPANSTVTLNVDFAGVDAGSGTWGSQSRTLRFNIGDAHFSTVDLAAHTMTVTSQGKTLRTFPISGGNVLHPTMGGLHDVLDKYPEKVFETKDLPKNDPDYYKLTSYSNVLFTSGGAFVHSAPWSVGSQGFSNVSHGCVNASPENAAWFFDFSRKGDLINVVNYVRLPELDQDGTTWSWPWPKWVAGDALANVR